MKKSVVTMLLILVALCLIYSSSDSTAAPSIDRKASSVSASSPLKKVIDIEENSETEEPTEAETEEEVSSEDETDKSEDQTNEQSNDDTSDKASNDSAENEVNVKTTTTTTNNSKLFKKSGREAIDEAMNGNDVGIMSEDYEFGDEVLPEVDTEGFFQHVYNKLWIATTGLQKVLCVISIMFFLASLLMVMISCLGDKRHLGWYLFSLLISCLVFIGALYAPQIVAAFSNWFVN